MTLDEYQQKALLTVINHDTHVFFDRVLGLLGESGELANKVKKWVRDDKADPAKINKKELGAELGDVLWYVATIAEYLDLSLDDIGKENLSRLQDRQKRGALGGSGDNR